MQVLMHVHSFGEPTTHSGAVEPAIASSVCRVLVRSTADAALTAAAISLCARLGGPPHRGAAQTTLVDTVCREVRTAMVADGLHIKALKVVGCSTPGLTAMALGILKNIARDAPNRKHLADSGAIPILVAAIAAPTGGDEQVDADRAGDVGDVDVEGTSQRRLTEAVTAIETLINVACNAVDLA